MIIYVFDLLPGKSGGGKNEGFSIQHSKKD